MLGGGLYEGANVLIKGRAGTGKTTLALQFLVDGANIGEKGVYLTFEESGPQLIFFGSKFFSTLNAHVEAGNIQVIDFSPHANRGKTQDRVNSFAYLQEKLPKLKEQGVKRVVIDGLQTFAISFFDLADLSSKKDTDDLRRTFSSIIVLLKKEGFTTFILSEDSEEVPDPYSFINFCVDGIITLSVNESLDLRILRIMKMRGSKHTLKLMAIKLIENEGVLMAKS